MDCVSNRSSDTGKADFARAIQVLKSNAEDIGFARISTDEDVVKVSVIS